MKQQMEEDENIVYWLDSEVPGYMGAVSFTIKEESISDILK